MTGRFSKSFSGQRHVERHSKSTALRERLGLHTEDQTRSAYVACLKPAAPWRQTQRRGSLPGAREAAPRVLSLFQETKMF